MHFFFRTLKIGIFGKKLIFLPDFKEKYRRKVQNKDQIKICKERNGIKKKIVTNRRYKNKIHKFGVADKLKNGNSGQQRAKIKGG